MSAPERIPAPTHKPQSLPLDALGFLPNIRWDSGMMEHWQIGEAAWV